MTTTDQQAVTVAQETMTRPGYVVWHSSEDDGGPDVGITVGLGDGKMLWVGERSGREGDGMGLLVYGDKSIDANAGVGEYDEIRDLIEHHVAPALSRLASVSSASAEGFVLVPRKLTDDMHEAVVKLDFHSTHDPLWPEYWAAMLDAAPKSEPVPATNQAGEVERKRFKPGKLNERQRAYIILASKFINGSPVPFCEMNVPETGMSSYRGLLTRGLMEETKTGFAKLTATGWEVASAIHRLAGREREALEIEAWVKSNG